MMSRLNLARVSLVIGLVIGLGSWWETVTHIGNPTYVLPDSFPEGATHAWYHAFREVLSDVAKMVFFLVVFFGPADLRTRKIWWLTLILMLGYYAPFWVGEPFLPQLSAPNLVASVVHVSMAAFAFLGLFLAFSAFPPGHSMTHPPTTATPMGIT